MELEKAVRDAVPGTVTLPGGSFMNRGDGFKPRRGYFEARVHGQVVYSLPSLARPFTKLREADMGVVADLVAAALVKGPSASAGAGVSRIADLVSSALVPAGADTLSAPAPKTRLPAKPTSSKPAKSTAPPIAEAARSGEKRKARGSGSDELATIPLAGVAKRTRAT